MTLSPVELLLWLVPVAIVGYACWGNRPSVDRFATAHDLTLDDADRLVVRAALVRTARGRVAGATVGALVALVLVVGVGSRAPAVVALATVLVGTLLGVGLSQFRRAPSSDGVRTASLTVRDPASYRPRRARGIVVGLLAVTVLYGAIVATAADHSNAGFAALVVAIALAGMLVTAAAAWLQRRIVEQLRDGSHAVPVDDALRSTSVRAIHHAVIGVLLCGVALVGFIGVESQMYTGIEIGDQVAFRFPTGATFDERTDVQVEPDMVSVHWHDAGGAPHTTVRATAGQGVAVGSLTADFALISLGFWVAVLGFLGGIVEWGRAGRAWRHRPRSRRRPSAMSAGSVG